ncbi:unnamed protein product [Protopolystoma xenopodis]|uniref:Uncharacterized protein n=1 Tax=Protopolystoma xenopodis TaxID=117903 RepID=A0A3S4ZZA8_9PLAT|nr:unnamed protein product [Protopolystoma xenopodis]
MGDKSRNLTSIDSERTREDMLCTLGKHPFRSLDLEPTPLTFGPVSNTALLTVWLKQLSATQASNRRRIKADECTGAADEALECT